MSFIATKWAQDQDIPNHCAKSLLIAIAGHINKTGMAWPSYKTLSKESGLGYSTVAKYLRLLAHFEFIRIIHRFRKEDNGRTSSYYFLPLDKKKGELVWLMRSTPNKRKPSRTPPTLQRNGPPLYAVEYKNQSVEPVSISFSKEDCRSGSVVADDSWLNQPSDPPFEVVLPKSTRARWAKSVGPLKSTSRKGVQFA